MKNNWPMHAHPDQRWQPMVTIIPAEPNVRPRCHNTVYLVIFPNVLTHVSSTALTALPGWRVHRCGPSPCERHKICFMARFTTICGNNPSQTSWGSVEKKGRFVRENTGSGQTSGSVRNHNINSNN